MVRPSAFARGIGEGVLLPHGAREIEDSGHDEEEEGQDQRELDDRLRRVALGEKAEGPHLKTRTIVVRSKFATLGMSGQAAIVLN